MSAPGFVEDNYRKENPLRSSGYKYPEDGNLQWDNTQGNCGCIEAPSRTDRGGARVMLECELLLWSQLTFLARPQRGLSLVGISPTQQEEQEDK